ncbi:MAG TPA: glycosyltransferase family 39 protein [Anaerolineae bacterium]|nr:glycosyltransferase family 39 protein [Anaerolineae bacterium]
MEVTATVPADRPNFGRRLAVVVVLLLIAFGMRTYQINDVPPGLMHSELLQLHAADQVAHGEWHMFYNPGYRNEPMYAPVLSASQAIFGPNAIGRRLPAIFAGMLGLCLVYVFALRTMGWRIALIALGASAVVWWSIVMQRFILRQVFVLPLYALCLYAFWRGYEEVTRAGRAGWRYFIIGGVALGAAQYDHTIPRGLFLVFVVFGLYLLLFHRSIFKRLWRGILLLVIVAELLAAPLLIYAALHPEENNLPQVDLFQDNGAARFVSRLPDTIGRVVGQFFWAGEGQDAMEYDIPYRPIFEPIGAAFLALGLLVAVWRWRRPVYAYLLMAWAAVLASAVLFNAEILFSRLLAAQATTYIFLGLGIEIVIIGLSRILNQRARLVVVTAGLISLFVVYLVVTARDMFVTWPSLNGAKWGYNTDMRDLGRYLAAQTQVPLISGCTVMNNPEYHETVSQLAAPFLIQRPDVRIAWHDCRYSMVIPAGGQYLYAYPTLQPLSSFLGRAVKTPWLESAYFQPVEGLNAVRRVDVRSVLADKLAEWRNLTVAWPPEAPISVTTQLPVDFNHSLELIGYALKSPAVKPGDNLRVETDWRVTGPVPDDLILFTHVYRTPNEVMAQQDRLDVVGSSLRAGDVFVQEHEFITIPPDTPAGSYWVGIGAYHKDTGERWPIFVGDQHVADRIFLTQVQVTP